MDEQKTKRVRRTPQQMAEQIDGKIQKLNQDLEDLEAKRAAANADFDAKAAAVKEKIEVLEQKKACLFDRSPRARDISGSRMRSSA